MACQIKFTTENKINRVENEKGEQSKLFSSIFNVPTLTLEESVEVYRNTYSDKVRVGKEESELNLTFETPSGNQFNSYQEALQNTTSGDILLKVNDVEIANINSDTSISTFQGTVNHLVKQGVLTGTRILDVDGSIITVVAGESETAKQLTSNIAENILVSQLGASSVTRLNNGDFILEDNLNTRIIAGEKVKESEINGLNFEQLKSKFGEDVAITLEVEKRFEKDMLPTQLKKRIDVDTEVKSEDELVRSIKSLLNKLGIKVTSIEDYIKNGTTKNGGVAPSASALMDVTNKIMAFKDGTITREDLIEETMHLIEATLPIEQTVGLRRNIHLTPEWKESSAQYYEIYSKEYSGAKLEEMVRREVLGKVMANAVTTNFEISQDDTLTQQSIFEQIKALLDEFFAKISAFFTENTQQQLDQLNKDVFVKLLSGELADELNVNQNFGTKFRLYSASTNLNNDLVQIQKQAEKALSVLEYQSQQIGGKDASQRQQLRSARESMGRVGEQFEVIEKTLNINDRKRLEKIAGAELAATFSYITNVAQKQLIYLQRAVKRNEQNDFHFSAEEQSVYHSMITQFDKYILPSITTTLEKKDDRTKAENRILEEVKKVTQGVEELKKTINVDQDTYKKMLVDNLVTRLGLSEDKRIFIENQVNSKQQDAGFFFKNFGNLFHSSNIMLNSVGHIINKMDHERRQSTLEQTLPFVKKLKDLGYLAGKKLRDFVKDGYIQNRFNDKVREEAEATARYEIYKEITGNTLTKEEFDAKSDLSDLTVDQKSLLDQKFSDWRLENYTLSALSAEETRERKKKLEGYSDITKNFESVSSKAYADLMENAETVNGVRTFTQEMKYDFEQIKKERVNSKNIYDLDGTIRDGIEYRSEQEYENSLVEIDGVQTETSIVKIGTGLYASLKPTNVSKEATLSFELTKIDNNRIATIKANKEEKIFPPLFLETLEKLDPSQAYDFLMLNAYVGYTNEYYEKLDRPSIIDKLKDKLGSGNDYRIEQLVLKIAETTKKMNSILQANRTMNNPSEVSFQNMELNTEVPQVLEYATDLEAYYSEASLIIGKNKEEVEEDSLSETIPNSSFAAYMNDKYKVSRLVYEKDILDQDDVDNINKIFSAIVDHSTQNNKRKVLDLKKFVKDFSNGRENRIPKVYSRVFSQTENEYGDMTEEQIFASMSNDLLRYSYTRMLPYFRKSQPTGVDLALNELRAQQITPTKFIENYLNGEYPMLNISPNYNFQQADSQNNKNPHFNQAKIEGTPLFRTFETNTTLKDVKNKSIDQLVQEGKLNRFVNTDFLKEYDIDLAQLFETGKEVARANVKKFEVREAFVDLQKQTLENFGKGGAHNIYLLPQKEQGRLRKWEDLASKGTGLRGLVDEFTSNREDESEFGQDAFGNFSKNMSAPTIPKFGLRRLKDAVVSDEILESYIWMNNESNLYLSRVKTIGDVLAIKEAMLGSEFEGDLQGEATNAYRMLEDTLKYVWFGQKETYSQEFQLFGKTADLGKVVKSLGQFIRFKNLAYNVTIPITSFLSGNIQLRIEKAVGERVDASGFNRGKKRFYKEAGGAMRDVLSLDSTSWLNAMGSKFGFYENQERYANSSYGKSVRGLGRSAYLAHTVANFAPNSITALSTLSDFRFVSGRLIQYREFKTENKGKSDKEVRAIWDNYKDILDVSQVDENGVIFYDYQQIADALNTNMTAEEAKEFMKGKDSIIAGAVKIAITAVDQQISSVDKNYIGRNAFANFLSIHRSWLFLAVQNRLKGRQLNTLSRQIEEGHWRTGFRLINSIVKDVRAGKTKDVLKYIKERWETGDETSKKNLIRGVTEMSILQILIGATVMGMKELGDDDDDSYAFKLANLFLMRATVEQASSSVALNKNVYDILSNATVGANVIDMAFDAPDLFSDREVTRGRFAGMSERERYLVRNLPGIKDYFNLYDIDNSISSYKHFNIGKEDNNLKYWTIYPLVTEE